MIKFLEVMGPGTHVLAVCQPCVAVLAAVAVMAQAGNTAQPRSMTLMAGPIDARVNPTSVNELAKTSHRMVRAHADRLGAAALSGCVPPRLSGLRAAAAFMSMNLERHVKAHRELYEDIANGEQEKAAETNAFYDEYFAVLDLTAEFYLETVRIVFQEYALPRGKLQWPAQVDPAAIQRTVLFTVEGERDDICAIGQTMAAHDLCTNFARISSAIICSPASDITACFRASAGRSRFIRF